MKALIGIDIVGTSDPAVRLFARMKFPNQDVTLLNVVDLVMPYTSFGVPAAVDATNLYVEGLHQAGEKAVEEARKLMESYGVRAETLVASGPCVLTVLDKSEELDADLVTVASTGKGTLATIFAGSMSRSIVTSSRRTVLVAKEGVKSEGPVIAVLATDHSPYADRAVEHFLELSPKGIDKIHVVTAYEVSDKEAQLLHANLPSLEGHIDQWIEGHLVEKCQALVGKLSEHGYQADYSLEKGDANDVISGAMKKTGAELLILGAQGHGFIDRLFVGSVSFRQLVGEKYSIFILRDQQGFRPKC